jgi:hypothetical protein
MVARFLSLIFLRVQADSVKGSPPSVEPTADPGFKVQFSIEKDFWAHQTLTLRAFYRQFSPGRVPGKYDLLRGAVDRDALFAKLREGFDVVLVRADYESWGLHRSASRPSGLRPSPAPAPTFREGVNVLFP